MDNTLSLRMSTNGFRNQERQGESVHCISDPKEQLCHALTGILNEYQFPEHWPLSSRSHHCDKSMEMFALLL